MVGLFHLMLAFDLFTGGLKIGRRGGSIIGSSPLTNHNLGYGELKELTRPSRA